MTRLGSARHDKAYRPVQRQSPAGKVPAGRSDIDLRRFGELGLHLPIPSLLGRGNFAERATGNHRWPRLCALRRLHPSLDAWAYILFDSNDDPLLRYFNSVVVGLASTALTVVLGGLAVYGLTRFQHAISGLAIVFALFAAAFACSAYFAGAPAIRLFFTALTLLVLLAAIRAQHGRGPTLGSNGILIAILATRILPPVVIVLPIYLMAQQTGTLDTRFALIATYTAANLPVAVWLLQPVLGEAATDMEEAAQLDGASRFRISSRSWCHSPRVASPRRGC